MVKQYDMILHVFFQSNILEHHKRFLWKEYFNFGWPRGNFW